MISQEHNIYMAAAALLDVLAGQSRGVVRKKVGGLEIQYDSEAVRERAKMLRLRGSGHQILTAGGVSLADRTTLDEDADLIQPYFKRGLHDNISTARDASERELP